MNNLAINCVVMNVVIELNRFWDTYAFKVIKKRRSEIGFYVCHMNQTLFCLVIQNSFNIGYRRFDHQLIDQY